MSFQHPRLAYRGPPKRTHDEGPGSQDKAAAHQTPQTPLIGHSSSDIINNNINSSSTNKASATSGKTKTKGTPSKKTGKSTGSNKTRQQKPGQAKANKAKNTPTKYRGPFKGQADAQTHKTLKRSHGGADANDEDDDDDANTAKRARTQHDPVACAQQTQQKETVVPAFHHLLLLESLDAPTNVLHDEYLLERRRLAKLYGLQLSQSEDEAVSEYLKNRRGSKKRSN